MTPTDRVIRQFSLSAAGLLLCASGCERTPEPRPVAPQVQAEPLDAGVEVVADPTFIPQAERDAEHERLRVLGIAVPDGGVVLERPFDPPYSRRSFVVPQAWFQGPSPDAGVAVAALEKDLPILREVMSRAYSGWETAERRGWSWDRWFAEWGESLRARGHAELPVAEAFEPIKRLMEFQLDNHTNIPLSRAAYFGSGSQSVVLRSQPKASCTELKTSDGARWPLDETDPAQRVRQARQWDPKARQLTPIWYLAVPGSRGQVASVTCGGAEHAARPYWPPYADRLPDPARTEVITSLSGATADEPAFVLLDPTIAYLRLPTFSKRNAQLIEERKPSWPKPTGEERALIVDLRDNKGGDAALDAVDGWIDLERMRPGLEVGRRDGNSCLYHALRWGYTSFSSRGLKPPLGDRVTGMLQGSINALAEPSPADCPRSFKGSPASWGYRQHTMAPPGRAEGRRRVIILVNARTGSDGEYMALVLASLPESVVVGTNTFGVAQYVQPGYSVLPHSRLPFRISLGTSDIYGDGRSVDGYGLDVDILLPTREDHARENLIALVKHLSR